MPLGGEAGRAARSGYSVSAGRAWPGGGGRVGFGGCWMRIPRLAVPLSPPPREAPGTEESPSEPSRRLCPCLAAAGREKALRCRRQDHAPPAALRDRAAGSRPPARR